MSFFSYKKHSVFSKTIFCLFLFQSKASKSIDFQNSNSGIRLKNSSSLSIKDTLTVDTGFVQQDDSSTITGDTGASNISTSNGGNLLTTSPNPYFSIKNSTATVNQINLDGNKIFTTPNKFDLDHRFNISGTGNKIICNSGVPRAGNSTFIDMTFTANNSTVALGQASNTSIKATTGSFTGCSITLDSDLSCYNLTLGGTTNMTINGNGYKLTNFGATNLLGNNIPLSLQDITLDLRPYGTIGVLNTISFSGNCVINGNGNYIGVGGFATGTIAIAANTTLRIYNATIHLNSSSLGSISFADTAANSTSILRLSNVTLICQPNVTWSVGQVIIDGPVNVMVAGTTLTFNTNAKLTVDGKTLTYDRRGNGTGTITAAGGNVSLLNGGRITEINTTQNFTTTINDIKQRLDTIDRNHANLYFSGAVTLTQNIFLGTDKQMFIVGNTTVTGNGFKIRCSNNRSPHITLSSNVSATFNKVFFDNLTDEHISTSGTATVTFGAGSQIRTMPNANITRPWWFIPGPTAIGNTILDGNGSQITLSSTGAVLVNAGAASTDVFRIKNANCFGIGGNNFVRRTAATATGTVIFQNNNLTMSSDWTPTMAAGTSILQFSQSNNIYGPFTFTFSPPDANSSMQILATSNLTFNEGSTFRYNPSVANRTLLTFANTSSQLSLISATLATTNTGVQLLNGTLNISGKSNLTNTGTALSEGAFIGNLTLVNDMFINIEPNSSFNVLSGCLNYLNKET